MAGSQGLSYGFALLVLSLVAVGTLSVALAVRAARRGASRGAPEFALLMAAVALWCFGHFFELACVTDAWKIFWAKVQYISILSVPVIWLLMAARYTGRLHLAAAPRIAAISLIPAATLILVFTNELHSLVWSRIARDPATGILVFSHGPWFFVNWAWAYLLLGTGTVLLLASLFTSPPEYRSQSAAVIVGCIIPWIGNLLYILGVYSAPVDITPFCFAASGFAFGWALFSRRFLDIVPIARDTVIDHMQEPMVVLDDSDRIVDANPSARALMEAGTRSLSGLSAGRVFPAWRRVIECARGEHCVIDNVALTVDRELRIFQAEVSTLRDARGRLTGRVMVLHECGRRRIVEEGLRRSEEKYRQLVESLGDVFFCLDQQGRVTYVSPTIARVTGYSPHQVMGAVYARFIHPEDLAVMEDGIRRTYRGIRGAAEFRLLDADGTTRHFRAYAYPLLENRRVIGLTGIMTDVTEKKKLVDQLRQAQKMEAIGKLVGGIAHDFNNNLTVIRGFAEMLLMGRLEGESRELVSEISKATDRGAGLVRQLMAFSRKRNLQSFDANELVRGMSRILGQLLDTRASLVTRLAPDPVRVHADPGQIELALMNLAVNARDAMSDGGTLTIETSLGRSGAAGGRGEAVIRVSDTGCGMDDEVKRHLFEPFFTTKEPGKGTGLGLSTVHSIVTQSGGRIVASSERGKGTTFELRFPCRKRGKTRGPEAREPRSAQTT